MQKLSLTALTEDGYLGIPFSKLLGILKETYKDYELILKEDNAGIKKYDYSQLRQARHTVDTFKFALETLNDTERTIIENEFFSEPKKQWYRDYFSKNTYYTKRQKAYYKFIDHLKG